MKKDEKDILEGLKAKSDAFKMPVSPDLWDAIEAEIESDGGKKKGIAWWKIGGVSSIVLLLGTAMIFSFGGGEGVEDSQNYLMTRGKQAVEERDSRFNRVQNMVLMIEASEPIVEVEEIPKEPKFESIENNNVQSSRSITGEEDVSFENGVEEGNFDEPTGQIVEVSELAEAGANGLNEIELEENEIPIADSINGVEVILPDTTITESISINSTEVTKIEVKDNKKKKPFSIMLTGGVGTSFRTLRSNTHGDLVIHKNDHETFGNAFDVGINVQFDLNSKLFLRSGFNYKFYSDKYDFHHDIIVHTTRNDYQYIQVPLSLGWRALNFGKSDLSLIGIGKWSRLYAAQSSWVDPSLLTPVAHNHQGGDTPFRKSTFGIGLVLDYRVQLSEKWNFHFIPGIDCFASSVYKRSTDIYQRPYALNADIGISYNF